MTEREKEQEHLISELKKKVDALETDNKCLRQEIEYTHKVGNGLTLNTSTIDKCIKDCINISYNSEQKIGVNYLRIASWLTELKSLRDFVNDLRRGR